MNVSIFTDLRAVSPDTTARIYIIEQVFELAILGSHRACRNHIAN